MPDLRAANRRPACTHPTGISEGSMFVCWRGVNARSEGHQPPPSVYAPLRGQEAR